MEGKSVNKPVKEKQVKSRKREEIEGDKKKDEIKPSQRDRTGRVNRRIKTMDDKVIQHTARKFFCWLYCVCDIDNM